jgi:hypothetical protein
VASKGRLDHQAVHQLEPLCDQFDVDRRDAGNVAARMREACDETDFDRVGTDSKDDRDCLIRRLSSQRSWRARSHRDNGPAKGT